MTGYSEVKIERGWGRFWRILLTVYWQFININRSLKWRQLLVEIICFMKKSTGFRSYGNDNLRLRSQFHLFANRWMDNQIQSKLWNLNFVLKFQSVENSAAPGWKKRKNEKLLFSKKKEIIFFSSLFCKTQILYNEKQIGKHIKFNKRRKHCRLMFNV